MRGLLTRLHVREESQRYEDRQIHVGLATIGLFTRVKLLDESLQTNMGYTVQMTTDLQHLFSTTQVLVLTLLCTFISAGGCGRVACWGRAS